MVDLFPWSMKACNPGPLEMEDLWGWRVAGSEARGPGQRHPQGS